jgi:hypothetical protein
MTSWKVVTAAIIAALGFISIPEATLARPGSGERAIRGSLATLPHQPAIRRGHRYDHRGYPFASTWDFGSDGSYDDSGEITGSYMRPPEDSGAERLSPESAPQHYGCYSQTYEVPRSQGGQTKVAIVRC